MCYQLDGSGAGHMMNSWMQHSSDVQEPKCCMANSICLRQQENNARREKKFVHLSMNDTAAILGSWISEDP
uniref:Uncharacterized protein n=1 Tax=Romanomermis culicivorax TaxID=13658 RepID=A0A915KL26_ROMCU